MRYQDVWKEQCRAAVDVLERHGPLSALEYLVGEKLMTYLAVAECSPEFAREVPNFIARIREVFDRSLLATYLSHLEDTLATEGSESREAAEDAEVRLARLARVRELLTAPQLGTA